MTEASECASWIHRSRAGGVDAANFSWPWWRGFSISSVKAPHKALHKSPLYSLSAAVLKRPSGPRPILSVVGYWAFSVHRLIMDCTNLGSLNVKNPVGLGDSAPHRHCPITCRAMEGCRRSKAARAVDHALARSSNDGGPGCSMMKNPPEQRWRASSTNMLKQK